MLRKYLALLSLALLQATTAPAEEPWYTYWGLGLAAPSYSSDLGDLSARIAAEGSEASRLCFNLDLYGFYWPERTTLVGALINLSGDFTYEDFSRKAGAISQLLVGPSAIHFFSEVGRGWFARSDIGLSKFAYDARIGEQKLSYSSLLGFGLSAGGGYSFPLNDETRLLFTALHSARQAQGRTLQLTTLTVGALF